MANDLNQCNFIGRLGKDPESKFTPSSLQVCNFSIAVGWKSKEKEGAEWVNITAFGKLAEICQNYLKKGSQVMISGKMKTDSWEKEGVKHYMTKIIADQMQMLGGKSEGQSNQNQGHQASNNMQQPQQNNAPAFDENGFDQDIPF